MRAIILDTEATSVVEPHATQIAWTAIDFNKAAIKRIDAATRKAVSPTIQGNPTSALELNA